MIANTFSGLEESLGRFRLLPWLLLGIVLASSCASKTLTVTVNREQALEIARENQHVKEAIMSWSMEQIDPPVIEDKHHYWVIHYPMTKSVRSGPRDAVRLYIDKANGEVIYLDYEYGYGKSGSFMPIGTK